MHIIVASAIVSIFVVMPVVYMLADTQPPYEYVSARIEPETVEPGQTVTVHWHLKINRKCKGINQRQVADSQGRIVNYDPTIAAGLSVSEKFSVAFTAPRGLAPGPAKYRVISNYSCNLMQSFFPLHVVTPDVSFFVGGDGT
jgi:hypothetical protein